MGPFYRFFGGPPLWVIFKLLILSLVVGVVLNFLGIDPIEIWYAAEDLFFGIWNMGFDALDNVIGYVIVGAIIVIPIWLILRLFSIGSRRQ